MSSVVAAGAKPGFLKSVKVGTRIYFGFAVVLALLLVIGGGAIFSIRDAVQAFDTEQDLAENALRVAKIDRDFVGFRRSAYVYLDAGKESDLKRLNELRQAIPRRSPRRGAR